MGCSNDKTDDDKVIYLDSSFLIDVDDKAAAVGFSDYVFIGHVEEQGDTVKNFSSDGDYMVYTPYKVKVLENIKGTLEQNAIVKVLKSGGYRDDGYLEIWIDDSLPEPGKTYVFLVNQALGNDNIELNGLLASGPNSSVLVESKTKGSQTSTKEFKEYEEAFKNQKLSKYKPANCYSEFDVNYEEAVCE